MPTLYTKINYRIFPFHCPSKIRRSQDTGSFIVSHAFLRWLNKATDIPIEGRNDWRSVTHQALVYSQTILCIAVDSSPSVPTNTVDLLTNQFLFTRPLVFRPISRLWQPRVILFVSMESSSIPGKRNRKFDTELSTTSLNDWTMLNENLKIGWNQKQLWLQLFEESACLFWAISVYRIRRCSWSCLVLFV